MIHTCFEQPSKDLSKPYCVYITFYRGNKMPLFYPGSGRTVDVLDRKYFGSPKSKRYSQIFKQELKDNPHLFESKVLCTFTDRKQATYKEYRLLKQLNVIKNSLYINQALPAPNGFFGMENGGDLHPHYGKRGEKCFRFGRIWSQEIKDKMRNSQIGDKNHMFGKISPMRGRNMSNESKNKMSISAKNKPPITEHTRIKLGKIISERNKGRFWITNGEVNRFVVANSEIPQGWTKGAKRTKI